MAWGHKYHFYKDEHKLKEEGSVPADLSLLPRDIRVLIPLDQQHQ